MRFVKDPKVVLTDSEQEILSALRHPILEEYLMAPEVESLVPKGVVNGSPVYSEDIWVFCAHKALGNPKKYAMPKRGKEVIPINLPESNSNESSASATIDRGAILRQCPSDQYWQIWYHTHNNTISTQSIDDQVSGQDLLKSGVGRTMCAAGLLGVTCHIQDGDDPVVVSTPWSQAFFDAMERKGLAAQEWTHPHTHQKTKQLEMDQILCYYDNPTSKNRSPAFTCTGKNFSWGVEDFKIGAFKSMAMQGEVDQYVDDLGTGQLIKPSDGKLTCMATGGKLFCQ